MAKKYIDIMDTTFRDGFQSVFVAKDYYGILALHTFYNPHALRTLDTHVVTFAHKGFGNA